MARLTHIMGRVICEKCGHSMSADWANITNKCPNCKEAVYSNNEVKENDKNDITNRND